MWSFQPNLSPRSKEQRHFLCPEDWHLLTGTRHFLWPWVPFCWCCRRGQREGSTLVHMRGAQNLCVSAQRQAEACLDIYQGLYGVSIPKVSSGNLWGPLVLSKRSVLKPAPLLLLIDLSLLSFSFCLLTFPASKQRRQLHIWLLEGNERLSFCIERFLLHRAVFDGGDVPTTDLEREVLAPSQRGQPSIVVWTRFHHVFVLSSRFWRGIVGVLLNRERLWSVRL